MIPITAKYIQDYFWLHRTGNKSKSIPTIESTICSHFNVKIEDVYGKSREQNVVECRHLIWWYIRKNNVTLSKIARLYNKHHTSILHSISKVENLLEFDEIMKRNIAEINTKLR